MLCTTQLLPPSAYTNSSTSFCARYAHTSTNKIRCPVNIVKVSLYPGLCSTYLTPSCLQWTPDARRVLTGSTSGEFTLWNGLTFNFETILQVTMLSLSSCRLSTNPKRPSQAHDTAVRAMEWSTSGQWLISADNTGTIKYFQTNMNNLQRFQGHSESIRDISW